MLDCGKLLYAFYVSGVSCSSLSSISASCKRHGIDQSIRLDTLWMCFAGLPPPRPTSLRSSCPTSESKATPRRPASKPHSWTLRFAGATSCCVVRRLLWIWPRYRLTGQNPGCGHVGENARRVRKLLTQEQLTTQGAARAEAWWPVGNIRASLLELMPRRMAFLGRLERHAGRTPPKLLASA